MKSLIYKLLLPFTNLYIKLRFLSLWDLKDYINQSNSNTYNFSLLINFYERELRNNGSWIGINSKFEGKPYFPHGIMGVFISNEAVIGKNVIIFQQVTIGSNTLKSTEKYGSPTLGNNVYIGAGAKIIGKIKIGNNCRIGANAVVYCDMPDNSVAVAASTRIIQKENLDNRFYLIRNKQAVYYDNGNWIKVK